MKRIGILTAGGDTPALNATIQGAVVQANLRKVEVVDRLRRLQIDGLICIGGDGTLNGMQAISNYLPTVLAPTTIDNDLLPIFTNAIGQDNMEDVRRTLFAVGNLTQPFHSVNFDINKRICYLN